MPSTNKRKDSSTAQNRMKKEYVFTDDKSNPYHLYIPQKENTEKLREFMGTRNYIRVMTRIDKNQFIVMQYYIYSEADMWVCGDSLVLNQNPDKKIWCQTMCSASKARCICYDEDSPIFLSVCPFCYKLGIFIKNTPFICENCKNTIDHKSVNDMPYAKIKCNMCPKEIGWDNAQKIRELIQDSLVNRPHVTIEVIRKKLVGELRALTLKVSGDNKDDDEEVDDNGTSNRNGS